MNITYAQAVRDALREELLRDKNVVLIGEDIGLYGGAFGVTRGLWEEFGEERIIEAPISETAFTGAAAGAALLGLRPVVEIMFGDFITLTADPVINHAAKYHFMSAGAVSVPMVLRTPAGSGTGAAAQHSQSLEALYLNTPGLKVIAPYSPYDVKGMLKSAIRDNSPVICFENKLLYRTHGEVPEGDYTVPLGPADIKRQGTDISLISYSKMTGRCLDAAQELEKHGISAEVVDLRSLRPLDAETLSASVKKTSRALIVVEAPLFGSFSGEIAAAITESEAFYYLDAPIVRLGGGEMPVPYNPLLEAQLIPSADDIANAASRMLGGVK